MKINPAIVSFASGKWYPHGLDRLRKSCEGSNYFDFMGFTEYPQGCPTHQDTPYAFKPYTMREAGKAHDVVLWCDSSGWLQNDPYPIFEQIKRNGYILIENGWTNAQWCNDRQLDAFGFTRDEAESQPHAIGGLFGIDFQSEIGQEIFRIYFNSISLFRGKWDNKRKTESQDPRCLGCRHDQSIISLIAAKIGLTMTDTKGIISFDMYDKDAIILMQGM